MTSCSVNGPSELDNTDRAGLRNVRTCSAEQGPPHFMGPTFGAKFFMKSKLFISKSGQNNSEYTSRNLNRCIGLQKFLKCFSRPIHTARNVARRLSNRTHYCARRFSCNARRRAMHDSQIEPIFERCRASFLTLESALILATSRDNALRTANGVEPSISIIFMKFVNSIFDYSVNF